MAGEMSDELDTQYPAVTSRSTHLTAADIRLLLELHDLGKTQVEIAQTIGCGQATVSRTLKSFDGDSKAVARQLRTFTDETIEDWRTARQVAAKRGDHRPARELLEAAYPELRPQPAAHGNHGGVTVIVAVPGGGENPKPAIQVGNSSTVSPQPSTLSPSLSPVIHKLTPSDV
jgi:DNA-binding CsgD family transcriptional regulator